MSLAVDVQLTCRDPLVEYCTGRESPDGQGITATAPLHADRDLHLVAYRRDTAPFSERELGLLELQSMGPGGPADVNTDPPDWVAQIESRMWEFYDSDLWSLPDRTGDWDTVVSSNMCDRRTWAVKAAARQEPLAHAVMAAAPVGPTRYVRLFGVRDGWGTFGERQLGMIELLKPHFVDAFRRSCVTEPPLTVAQRRVLRLVSRGHTNRQVGRELGISEATVRTHLQNAYEALGVNNRVAAVAATFGDLGPALPTQRRETGG